MSQRDPASEQISNYANSVNTRSRATDSNGAPVDSLTNTQTFGPRGPIALQDFVYLDHNAAFNRERIPERVVHAKGAGAYGYLEITHDITKYCKAKIFSQVGKRTPAFLRFSTVGGESGSADTARDPRGFALKFYTEDGNWDLVGNNTPIFFIRDPIFFPSFIHTQKRNPQTHLKDPDMFWDFISLRPETTHQVSFLFSDRGTPDGYRHMHGFGSHTYKMVNAKGEAVYVKFHFKSDQGIKNLCPTRASELAGSDPDYATRDLYNSIARGDYPSWSFYIQVMTFEQAEKVPFNPFDLTKIWPQKQFPLLPVGKLVLNRNPKNYFAEVEQSAFAPAHMVPGIEPSPDKMLQGRLWSYADTHRYRLGPNYKQLPINCPFNSKVNNYQRDGTGRYDDNQGGAPNYFPNSFSGPEHDPSLKWHHHQITGDVARHETADDDNFSQVSVFYNKVLTEQGRENLTTNIAEHLSNAAPFIQKRVISNFSKVDPDYGRRIEQKIAAIKASRSKL